MQINRLLEIVYILLRQRRVTAKDLAERFGVSTRTIYRDIDNLSLSGIPVYTEKGKNGGISLLPDFVLSKSILSEEEQNEILSALHGLSSVQVAEAGHVLQKLSAVFNKSAVSWLEVDFTNWGFSDGLIFADIKTAVLERRVIEFDYYSAVGEKTRRRAEPIQLWFKSRAWYMKGFCLTRQDIRLFKLSRIQELTVTHEIFPKRDLLAAAPKTDEPPAPYRNDITFTVKIAAVQAFRVLDEFGGMAFKQPDGSYIVTITWPEDEWMYGYILSFGEHLEVLEPERVKDIIREKAEKIARKYTVS